MHDPLWITPPVRTAIFFGLLFMLLALERLWPRRTAPAQRGLRWPSNLGLSIVNSAMLALIPAVSVGAAYLAQARGWGLFNQVSWPPALEVALAWLLLDGVIYWQHRLLHQIRGLWPLHRVHHSDIEFDTTTAVRFHPSEILLSLAVKSAAAIALGAPPLAVVLLETAVNAFALFNHANWRLSPTVDRALRWFIVTPDVHRVHHSVHRIETDSNYGATLILWDHLFGSYRAQPRDGHTGMRIGLEAYRDRREQTLGALLSQPVR